MRNYFNGRSLIIFSCLAAFALLLASLGGGAHAGAPPSMSAQMANAGYPISPSAAMQATLARTDTNGAKILLLTRRDGLSFYRIAGSGRGECFALGHGDAAAATIGVMTCDGGFGWHGEAVKDASLWTYDKSSQVVRFAQIQGFATNRVKEVVAYAADGSTVASARVSRNVYSIPQSDLSAIAVTRIAALDGTGAALFQKAVPSRETFLALS
jgi:hypothetical protein